MLLPAAEEDADPFISQGADNDPVTFLCTLVHLVEGAGPEAVADGFIGVFVKALVNKKKKGSVLFSCIFGGGVASAEFAELHIVTVFP